MGRHCVLLRNWMIDQLVVIQGVLSWCIAAVLVHQRLQHLIDCGSISRYLVQWGPNPGSLSVIAELYGLQWSAIDFTRASCTSPISLQRVQAAIPKSQAPHACPVHIQPYRKTLQPCALRPTLAYTPGQHDGTQLHQHVHLHMHTKMVSTTYEVV